jgi:HEAT repeat protein
MKRMAWNALGWGLLLSVSWVQGAEPIGPALIDPRGESEEGSPSSAGEAARTVSALVKTLAKDDRPEARREALLALGAMGPAAAAAVPATIKMLDDPDYGVRLAAVYALGRFGPAAKAADGALRRRLHGSMPPMLEFMTLWALARIHPRDEPTVRRAVLVLIESTWSKQPRQRAMAVRCLIDLRPAPELIVPPMTQLIARGDAEARSDALDLLRAMGEPAVSALRDETGADDPRQSLAAAWALIYLDPDRLHPKAKAVPKLIRALEDRDPLVRLEAAASLRILGREARSAVDSLRLVAQHDRESLVRDVAGGALRAVEK